MPQSDGPPRKQHVVSRAVLRRFECAGSLQSLDVRYPTSGWRRSTAAAEGYVRDFVAADAAAVEKVWKDVEDRLPAAFAELDSGRMIAERSDVERTLQDCLAMHWARSKAVKAVSERAYRQVLARTKVELAARPDLLDRGFRETTGGLHAAGPEARAIAHERLTAGPPEVVDGRHFAGRVVEMYGHARDKFSPYRIQVYDCLDDAGALIISDAPVVAPDSARSGLNPLAGVALEDVSSAAMPLGPRVAVSLHTAAQRLVLTAEQIRDLNAMQEDAADERLYRRPPAAG